MTSPSGISASGAGRLERKHFVIASSRDLHAIPTAERPKRISKGGFYGNARLPADPSQIAMVGGVYSCIKRRSISWRWPTAKVAASSRFMSSCSAMWLILTQSQISGSSLRNAVACWSARVSGMASIGAGFSWPAGRKSITLPVIPAPAVHSRRRLHNRPSASSACPQHGTLRMSEAEISNDRLAEPCPVAEPQKIFSSPYGYLRPMNGPHQHCV
jgi:hypothetical protein